MAVNREGSGFANDREPRPSGVFSCPVPVFLAGMPPLVSSVGDVNIASVWITVATQSSQGDVSNTSRHHVQWLMLRTSYDEHIMPT